MRTNDRWTLDDEYLLQNMETGKKNGEIRACVETIGSKEEWRNQRSGRFAEKKSAEVRNKTC